MIVEIRHTQPEDIGAIFELYDDAIAYQKAVGNNHWLGFEELMVRTEIGENRHYKLLFGGELAGTFCITCSDPVIWQAANDIPAVYIHRIATSRNSRGLNLVKHIIEWARAFARENNLSFVRMDTGSGNDRLINYYVSCGFSLLGNTSIAYAPGLPAHYENASFALLEMPV